MLMKIQIKKVNFLLVTMVKVSQAKKPSQLCENHHDKKACPMCGNAAVVVMEWLCELRGTLWKPQQTNFIFIILYAAKSM